MLNSNNISNDAIHIHVLQLAHLRSTFQISLPSRFINYYYYCYVRFITTIVHVNTCLVHIDHVDLSLGCWPRTLVMVDFWNAQIFVEWRYNLWQLLHVVKEDPAVNTTISIALSSCTTVSSIWHTQFPPLMPPKFQDFSNTSGWYFQRLVMIWFNE